MDNSKLSTNSEIPHFLSADSTEFYEYIVIADDTLETVNVANIPSYVPYYLTIIFGLGVIAGLFFGWVSSWRL